MSILILVYSIIWIGILANISDTNAEGIENSFTGKNFMIDVGKLSPSENKYTNWPQANISSLLERATQILLIVIPTLAVLFIVIWWIKMITAWWDSSKISSAKNIITYNIIAVAVALLSFSIIQLIVWLLWSTS